MMLTLFILIRYTRHCNFQVALLPAKSGLSFFALMQPIIDELDLLSKKALRVRRNGQEVGIAKVYALFINGDGVQVNELMGYAGHNQ